MQVRPNFRSNTIWTGDNLYIMRGMNSATIDLIYLDPPFNSNADYAAPIGSKAAGAAFTDTWTLDDLDIEWLDLIESKHLALHRVVMAAMTDSDKSYLVYMATRLLEMKRLLKPTGSIYLHCDPTMSHYLKLVMDAIWGRKNFRREIVWSNQDVSGYKSLANNWIRGGDTLLYYNMDHKNAVFNKQYGPLSEKTIKRYDKRDAEGRAYKIYKNKNGESRIVYLDESKGRALSSIWTDILGFQTVNNTGELVHYPTQKPLALLKRIITASSNESDLVLDPFCGCATTCVAAEVLDRAWVGIDISEKAYELVNSRLREKQGAEYYKDGSKQSSFLEDVIHRTDIPQRTDLGKLPKYNSEENKRSLYGSQAGYCASCEEHFAIHHLEVDHIVARSKGGSDHISNLQLLCGHCNRVKGNRGMEYLRKRLRLAA